jgi:hypothetical protein
VTLTLTDVDLTEFAAWSLAPQATQPSGKLLLHTGTLSTTLNPILGERQSKPGTYDVPTPVARFTSIGLASATATLTSGAKTFKLTLDEVQLSAQAGAYQGKSNTVAGTLKLNGAPVTLGSTVLDATFAQAAFDAAYVCTGDLLATVPPN